MSLHDAYGTKSIPNRTILPSALEETQHFLASIREEAIKAIQGVGVRHAGAQSWEKVYIGTGLFSLMDRQQLTWVIQEPEFGVVMFIFLFIGGVILCEEV